jgi:hypothetical protein
VFSAGTGQGHETRALTLNQRCHGRNLVFAADEGGE